MATFINIEDELINVDHIMKIAVVPESDWVNDRLVHWDSIWIWFMGRGINEYNKYPHLKKENIVELLQKAGVKIEF